MLTMNLLKHTGKKKLIEYRDKVQKASNKREKEKKIAKIERTAVEAAAKAVKKAKDIANGVGDEGDVKMHFKFLKKGGKAGKASFKSSKKYKGEINFLQGSSEASSVERKNHIVFEL